MKYCYLLLMTLWLVPASANPTQLVATKNWIHGAQNCQQNKDPAIDVLAVSPDTYLLRQNKCINVEAPFIYVFFGQHTVFVQDTGATESAEQFPIYATIQRLIDAKFAANGDNKPTILVTHTAGDIQFEGQENVVLVGTDVKAVVEHYGLKEWPMGEVNVDLGGRQLTIFPIPGHQDASIAVYDSQTQWLLTGDTFYPGRLYVREWADYKISIQKLVDFTSTHPVTALMGTHIEISNTPGDIFDFGLDYQPNEAPLPLTIEDLNGLNAALIELGSKPQERTLAKVMISPVGPAKKLMGKILGWIF
jgi:glyoxylase-like metal-dependent hydrolase (beta-lactamase superfamily II)